MSVSGRIQEMLRPTFAHTPFRRLSTSVPFGSHFPILHGCFWPPFSRLFGSAELAVTSGSSPQSSCIQGCRYSATLLFACRGCTTRLPVVWVDM